MVNSPFRRSVRAETKRSSGRRGGSFYDRYRLPQDIPTAFMLIDAEYVDPNPLQEEITRDSATGRPLEVKKPYFKFRKHRVKLNQDDFRDEICSAGHNPHNPQPCLGCFYMDQGDRRVGVADNFAFGIVHLAIYHRHPLIDKKSGGVVMKREGNAAVVVDDECLGGRNCNFCRVLGGQAPINDPENPWPNFRPQDITTVFGKRRYLELGKNHLQDLMAWDATVSSYCGNDGQQLITDGFKCPRCNTMVIDMQQDTRTDPQIQEAVAQPYPCLTCNMPVMLQEVIACEECERNQRQPLQLSIFGRVLFGCRQGEGTSSHMVLQRNMSLDELARQVDPRLLPQGKTLQQHVADLAKPYDFSSTFQPKDLRGQSERLTLPLPPQLMSGPGYATPQGPQYGSAPAGGMAPAGAPGPMYGAPGMAPMVPAGAPMVPAGAPQAPQYAPYPGTPAPAPIYPPGQQYAAPGPGPAPAPGPAPFAPAPAPHFGRS